MVVLLLLGGLGVALFQIAGHRFELPGWAAARIERALAAGSGDFGMDLDSVAVEVDLDGTTRLYLRNLALTGPDGSALGQVNAVTARLRPRALLKGDAVPAVLTVSGAQLTLRRNADGALGVRLGAGGAATDLFDGLHAAFVAGPLAPIRRVAARDLTITLEDARSGRLWQVTGGRIDIRNEPERVEVNVISDIFDGSETLAGIQLSFSMEKDDRAAVLTARISEVPARDVALQAPALAFLGALDARVSGALRTVFAGDGAVQSLDGTLDIGAGALQPVPEARPLAFAAARAYFSYDPPRSRLAFSELSVESDTLRMSGSGHAYLRDFDGAWPNTLLAQVSLSDLVAAPEGVFDDAVSFEDGHADIRLRLDPFEADFGQVVLRDGTTRVDASGRIAAGSAGWSGAADLGSPSILPDRILALWPVSLGTKLRGWLSENLISGRLSDVVGAVRIVPGERPRFGFTFDFDEARIRFLPEMPPIAGGRGHAALQDGGFTVVVAEGRVAAEGGGPVAIGGSSFRIGNVLARPSRAVLKLLTRSSVSDVLRVMEHPPFRILSKLGRPADFVSASADLETEVRFPIVRRPPPEEVSYRVAGRLGSLRSEVLVPGRRLVADSLEIEIVPDRLTVSGPVTLDDLSLDDLTFRRPLGAAARTSSSRVDATLRLAPPLFEMIGLDLPQEMLAGEGEGRLTLILEEGEAPAYTLVSDLDGLAIAVPALGWAKPPATDGRLEVAGALGAAPRVDRLSLSAPGLDATGRIEFADGGGFSEAVFERVTAGTWFDAPLRIEGRGAGVSPGIAIAGGRVDLAARPETPGGDGQVPLSLRLDELRISDRIALTGFAGDLVAGAGLDGRFRARVNGGVPVSGVLVPRGGRSAIRLQSEDAGATLRDARLFRTLSGGSLDLILTPQDGAAGFDGQIEIENAVLRGQSVVIDMLDAVSVVGLIDQIRGAGVLFDTIEGRFRLDSERLTLTEGAAVGASLGVSLDGIYDIAANRLDLQGVLSPIYLLNAVGQIFTRRGEGLFGFTFRVSGPADAPEIGVNPLSILTPGMFRDLFRRPPPE